MVHLGLIGAGRWGRCYICTLKNMPGVRLARLASTNPESTGLVDPGCPISSDWREVVTDKRLDGIIIATPPKLHAQMAMAALNAGLHVLVEKPMTTTAEEARRLEKASLANRRMVFVGHIHLFSDAFRRLKQKGRELGRLKRIHSSAGNWGPCRPDTTVLWDWGPHDIAMSLDLAGSDPDHIRIKKVAAAQLPEGSGERLEITMRFPGGVDTLIRISNIDPKKSRLFEAYFEKGTLVYNDLAEEKLRISHTPGEKAEALTVNKAMPLETLISEFSASIRSGSYSHPSLQLGRRVVRLLSDCQEMLGAET